MLKGKGKQGKMKVKLVACGVRMVELSEDFEGFLEDYGVPQQAQELTPERALELRGHLPGSIIDFWLEYGFGSVLDGLFRFCDPADYRSILALLFKADKDFSHKDCHVYGYSAFGELYIWSEKHDVVNIELLKLKMSAVGLLRPEDRISPDIEIGISLEDLEDNLDIEADHDEKLLFKRALKKVGKLNPGEVYGFKLAPALGGGETLDALKKYSALEHFAILAQMGDLQLVDYSKFPAEFIRTIG